MSDAIELTSPGILVKPKLDPSIVLLNTLHPSIRDRAITAYKNAVRRTPNGIHPVINEALRTFDTQAKYYKQGRTTKGEIITHCKPGYSYHQYGLAVDFFLLINGKDVWNENHPSWKIVVTCFKEQGFGWGGDYTGSFKDYPHLEYKPGLTIGQCLAKYNAKDFIPGTSYINI